MILMVAATVFCFNQITKSTGLWRFIWIFTTTLIMFEVYNKWAIFVVKRHFMIVENIKKFDKVFVNGEEYIKK